MPKKTLDKIIETQNHYVVQVKKNQPNLFKELQEKREQLPQEVDIVVEVKGVVSTSWEVKKYEFESKLDKWKTAITLLIVQKTIIRDNETILSTRYYISDRNCTAKQFNKRIRQHWGIENLAHRPKDMNFNQDKNKAKNHNAAVVRGVFNTIAANHLNILYRQKGDDNKKTQMTKYIITYQQNFKNFILV